MNSLWWLVLLLALLAPARAEELGGALQPIEPTALVCEHLVVRVAPSPSGSRVELDATLHNPLKQQSEASLMLLATPELQVLRADAPVKLELVEAREHKVATFLVRLDPGQRMRLSARWHSPGRSLRLKLPEPGSWNGYESCTLFVTARPSWQLAVSPPVARLYSTVDDVVYGASLGPNQAGWVDVEVSYQGPPIWLFLIVLPAAASLAAGALALAWPGPPAGRAVGLAYLINGPLYFWLAGEGYTAWQPGPLPLFVCFAAGPVAAALYSVLGFPRRGIIR